MPLAIPRRPRRTAPPAPALLAAAPAAPPAPPPGPLYPPPGGVTHTHNGALPGSSTGRVNRYTGFNTAGLHQLFWAFNEPIANPRHNTQAATGNMAYQGFNAATGIATWSSTSNLTYASPAGTQ